MFLLPEEESGSQSEMRAQLDIPSVYALKAVIRFNGTQSTRGNYITVKSKSWADHDFTEKHRISSLHVSHCPIVPELSLFVFLRL